MHMIGKGGASARGWRESTADGQQKCRIDSVESAGLKGESEVEMGCGFRD